MAITVAAGFGISLASRSLAVSTAAGEFDQFLDSARTIARDLDGATLAFTADAYGDGTEVRLLAGGPNGPPTPTTLPTLHARATIEEAESLGKAPFAFIVHANGLLSGRPGYHVGDAAPRDVGCPASGAFHFVIKTAGGSADRYVPCRMQLAANGPVALTTWPLAPIAPSPTPCSGPGCTATSLPSVPASTASCPPNFTPTGAGCAPVPPASATARYHVTITGAPASINVGASASFTAQATLSNPNAVAAGTPASIPVGVQSADAACGAGPAGWQSSGSTFTVTGIAVGTCAVTVQADPSGIPGATTDTSTTIVTVTFSPTPSSSPTPSPCDLVTNGKCYRRIVDQTSQLFYKYVLPNVQCGDGSLGEGCWYIDSIRQIILEPAFSVSPTVPPQGPNHELLVRIDAITGVTTECQPFSAFASMSGADTIQWGSGSVIGGPVAVPLGFGDPVTYSTVNHFSVSGSPNGSFTEPDNSWTSGSTLQNLYDAVASRVIGLPSIATYSSSEATNSSYVQWYPDFPGCDVAGDPSIPGHQYGISGAVLQFEVFQAQS